MRGIAAMMLLGAAAATGCQTSYDRVEVDGQPVEIRPLDGWSVMREKGTAVYRGPADEGLDRVTIAIRAVPIAEQPNDLGRPERVLDATDQVLSSLRDAEIHGRYRLDNDIYEAHAFDLTYRPPRSDLVDRRHVVLLGSQTYVIHVFLTAPQGELDRAAGLFAEVVESLREV